MPTEQIIHVKIIWICTRKTSWCKYIVRHLLESGGNWGTEVSEKTDFEMTEFFCKQTFHLWKGMECQLYKQNGIDLLYG